MVRAGVFLILVLSLAAPAHAQVDTTPPVVTTDVLTSLIGLTFRFDEPVIGITTSNVTVSLPGAAALPGGLRCKNAAGAPVTCNGGATRSITFVPSAPFVTGETYEAEVNPSGAVPQVTDGTGNVAAAYRRLLRAPSSAQESAPGMRYRWRRVRADAAGDDVYVTERRASARAIYRFTGTSVTWITVTGPSQGIATVFIDGIRVATVDTGAPTVRYRVGKTFSGLADRAHSLVVRIEGRAGRGRGAWIAVDGFRSGAGTVNETAGSYTWPSVSDRTASGGTYATTPSPGAVAEFTFRGRGVDWITHTGPDQGMARVFIDNVEVRTFDNYSTTRRAGVRRTITNLSDAQHRISIMVSSSRNRASSANFLRIDAFVLRAATVDFRRLGAWVDLYDYTDSTDPAPVLDEMDAHGVRTLYIQTGRYSTAAFHRPTGIGRWLEAAHARGIKVIGWYLPRYDEPITNEVTKTAAIAGYRSPAGHRFDGLGIDIEYRTDPDTNTHLPRDVFFDGITKHLRLVRTRVGVSYPIGAITFAPLDMDIWPGGWDGFPWSAVARYADVAMPMSYWSNRYDRCEGAGSFDPDPRYCVSGYTRENIVRTRALTGLPVHIIGGVMTHSKIGPTAVRTFTDAAIAERAYGASLYDAVNTQPSEWTEMRRANTL